MNKTLYFADKKLDYLELRYSKSNNCYKDHIHNTLSIGAILNGKRTYVNKNKSFTLLKNQLAKDLLKDGLSISQTALECGFFDQSHFHRNFKKIVAITPKEYQDNFVQ